MTKPSLELVVSNTRKRTRTAGITLIPAIPEDSSAAITQPASDEYTTGYKRPPKSTQFKPGKSGNPKGRPKGSKNTLQLYKEELETKVSITLPNGERQKISKRELFVKAHTKDAIAGKGRSRELLLRILSSLDDQTLEKALEATRPQTQEELTLEDQEILDYVFKSKQNDENSGVDNCEL